MAEIMQGLAQYECLLDQYGIDPHGSIWGFGQCYNACTVTCLFLFVEIVFDLDISQNLIHKELVTFLWFNYNFNSIMVEGNI